MKLNNGQQLAVNQLVDGFLSEKIKGFTLLGEGGTGKTTCVMFAIEAWVKAGLRVLVTAPTNKAVKQLEKAARKHGLKDSDQILFCTVAKSLGLAMLPSEDKKYAAQVGNCIYENFDVVVIDEGSMVSKIALFSYILPAVENTTIKPVIMGDSMQLPPVKETKSLALALTQYPSSELTEVERFGDGPIAVTTAALRKAVKNAATFSFDAATFGIKAVKSAYFVKEVCDAFELGTDLDHVRALAWTNSRVDTINDAVRKKLYGADLDVFAVGERVVTGAPIYEGKDLLLSTDEECIVRNFEVSSIMDEDTGKEYKTYLLTLEPIHAEVKTVYCHVIHASAQIDLAEDLQEIANRANKSGDKKIWAKYHYLKDLFAVVKYCYCITVHRSQGSTYETVFIDTTNILKNTRKQERNQLLYVAHSRASKEIIVSKERFMS